MATGTAPPVAELGSTVVVEGVSEISRDWVNVGEGGRSCVVQLGRRPGAARRRRGSSGYAANSSGALTAIHQRQRNEFVHQLKETCVRVPYACKCVHIE